MPLGGLPQLSSTGTVPGSPGVASLPATPEAAPSGWDADAFRAGPRVSAPEAPPGVAVEAPLGPVAGVLGPSLPPKTWEERLNAWRNRANVEGARPWPTAPELDATEVPLPPPPAPAPPVPPIDAVPSLPPSPVGPKPPVAPAPSRPVDLLPAYRQQDDYSCGTTSTAMLLTAWGKPTTKDQVNEAVRQAFLPSAPDDLKRYLESRGMRASLKAGASLEELAAEVEAGRPVLVLFDPISEGRPKASHDDIFLHYVVAQGVVRDAQGRIEKVRFRDPGDGRLHEVKAEDFLDAWSRLRVKDVETGITRLMISAVPDDAAHAQVELPSNFLGGTFHPTRLGRTVIQGGADLLNGWKHREPGRVMAGLLRGLVGSLAALPFLALSTLGHRQGWEGLAKVSELAGGVVVGSVSAVAGLVQASVDGLWSWVRGR